MNRSNLITKTMYILTLGSLLTTMLPIHASELGTTVACVATGIACLPISLCLICSCEEKNDAKERQRAVKRMEWRKFEREQTEELRELLEDEQD